MQKNWQKQRNGKKKKTKKKKKQRNDKIISEKILNLNYQIDYKVCEAPSNYKTRSFIKYNFLAF